MSRSLLARARSLLSPFPGTGGLVSVGVKEVTDNLTLHVRHIPMRNFWPILYEPFHPLLKAGESINNRRLQRQGRIERYQSDKALDGKLHGVSWSE